MAVGYTRGRERKRGKETRVGASIDFAHCPFFYYKKLINMLDTVQQRNTAKAAYLH